MDQSTIERELDRKGILHMPVTGSSMEPVFHDRKTIIRILPLQGRLKKGDIPVYQAADGQYIAHRILAVRAADYITCGDNGWRPEQVAFDRVIGVVSAFMNDGTMRSVDDPSLQAYIRLLPLRRLGLRLRSLPGRAKRQLRRRHEQL